MYGVVNRYEPHVIAPVGLRICLVQLAIACLTEHAFNYSITPTKSSPNSSRMYNLFYFVPSKQYYSTLELTFKIIIDGT